MLTKVQMLLLTALKSLKLKLPHTIHLKSYSSELNVNMDCNLFFLHNNCIFKL